MREKKIEREENRFTLLLGGVGRGGPCASMGGKASVGGPGEKPRGFYVSKVGNLAELKAAAISRVGRKKRGPTEKPQAGKRMEWHLPKRQSAKTGNDSGEEALRRKIDARKKGRTCWKKRLTSRGKVPPLRKKSVEM